MASLLCRRCEGSNGVVFVKREEGKRPLLFLWIIKDSNLGPTGYEPVALTAALMIRIVRPKYYILNEGKSQVLFLEFQKNCLRLLSEAIIFYKKRRCTCQMRSIMI